MISLSLSLSLSFSVQTHAPLRTTRDLGKGGEWSEGAWVPRVWVWVWVSCGWVWVKTGVSELWLGVGNKESVRRVYCTWSASACAYAMTSARLLAAIDSSSGGYGRPRKVKVSRNESCRSSEMWTLSLWA